MNPYNRYLRLVTWARKRYTVNGSLVVSVGGIASPYSLIEQAAAVKFLGV